LIGGDLGAIFVIAALGAGGAAEEKRDGSAEENPPQEIHLTSNHFHCASVND